MPGCDRNIASFTDQDRVYRPDTRIYPMDSPIEFRYHDFCLVSDPRKGSKNIRQFLMELGSTLALPYTNVLRSRARRMDSAIYRLLHLLAAKRLLRTAGEPLLTYTFRRLRKKINSA